jgi:hypothetical protein
VVTCFYANDTNSLQNRMENVPLQESLPEHWVSYVSHMN